MPSRQHSLGKLEHIHNNQNLKLRTKLSLSLSSAGSFPPHPNHLSDLETLSLPTAWIAGGNRLYIHVHIHFDDVMVLDVPSGEVIEDIGVMLCNSAVPVTTIIIARMADRAADVASASTQPVSQYSLQERSKNRSF